GGEIAHNDPSRRDERKQKDKETPPREANDDKPTRKVTTADEESDGAAEPDANEPRAYDVKMSGSGPEPTIDSAESASLYAAYPTRRYRVSLVAGGGIAHVAGENAGLFEGGLRFDYALTRVFAGVEGSLLVIDGDVNGRALGTISMPTVMQLEPSIGLGVQFGTATGPAWNIGLRIHMPSGLRLLRPLSIFVRYDGTVLDSTLVTEGSAGVEWAF
ncbi:MAG TPA: hypothetical protein VGM39_05685, partial [Kofleriaceae bacterium]